MLRLTKNRCAQRPAPTRRPATAIGEDVDLQLLEEVRGYLSRRPDDATPAEGVDAWEHFYFSLDPFIRGIIRAYCRASIDPDDVAQDVWQAVIVRLPDYRHDASRGSFKSWLFTVIRHRLSDLMRRGPGPAQNLAPHEFTLLPGRMDAPDEACERELVRGLVGGWIEDLRPTIPDRSYRVFCARCLEGRTVAEVGLLLSLSPEQVRTCHHRVLIKLRGLAKSRREAELR